MIIRVLTSLMQRSKQPATTSIFRESVDGKDASFTSEAKQNADGTYTGSYYYMTALNFSITKELRMTRDYLRARQKQIRMTM